jgi:hypothetical protein
MRPRDWFSVGIRLLGAYLFYRSISYWLSILADFFYQIPKSELAREIDSPQSRVSYILVFAVGYMVLSYAFVFGAERITRLAFNETSPESDNPVPN